jgi:hypothetical protein
VQYLIWCCVLQDVRLVWVLGPTGVGPKIALGPMGAGPKITPQDPKLFGS